MPHGNSKLALLNRLIDTQRSIVHFEEIVKTNPENQAYLDHLKTEYAKLFSRVYG